MALIDCPLCTKRIPNRKSTCAHCGSKIIRLDLDLSEPWHPGVVSDYAALKSVRLVGAAMVVAGPVAWSLEGDAISVVLVFSFGAALSLIAWMFSHYSRF